MSTEQRQVVEKMVRAAYRNHTPQWAAYLELCLKTNEAPR